MPSDMEIYQSATVSVRRFVKLIRQYGDGAGFHTAIRADAMLEAGDLDGLSVSKRIIRAVDELSSRTPDGYRH